MDFELVIIILKVDMNRLSIKEYLVEWGGELFSQDPAIYKEGTGLQLKLFDDAKYYNKYLMHELKTDEYIFLKAEWNDLNELYWFVHHDSDQLDGNKLLEFLQKVINLNEYYIFIDRDDDGTTKSCSVIDSKELRNVIANTFEFPENGGILITHANNDNLFCKGS